MKLLLVALLILPSIVHSQTSLEQELDSINSQTEAMQFLKSSTSKNYKLISFNKEKHKTRIAQDLFDLSKGAKKTYDGNNGVTHYKIIDKKKVLHYRVSVITLTSELSLSGINNLRERIIESYKKGYNFKDLAKLYSMEYTSKRTGGDLGWLTAGDMYPEFENAVFKSEHLLNSIFTLDLPEYDKYYIVLKTHENTEIEVIDVLKLTETQE